jgi:hypothetical protein
MRHDRQVPVAILFVAVLIVILGGSFALTVKRARHRRRLTDEERASSRLAKGGSVTAPLVEWLKGRRRRG